MSRRRRSDGYRSRAAYKLIEIDERYRLLKPGQRIVDLGAAPGGWAQVAAKKVGVDGQGQDRRHRPAADRPARRRQFAVLDFLDPERPGRLKAMLGGPADLVLSDMAANTTGHKKTDQLRIIAMVELAADFACEVLAEAAASSPRCSRAARKNALLARLKASFAAVHHVKPEASRAGSSELYVLATGFRGATRAACRQRRVGRAGSGRLDPGMQLAVPARASPTRSSPGAGAARQRVARIGERRMKLHAEQAAMRRHGRERPVEVAQRERAAVPSRMTCTTPAPIATPTLSESCCATEAKLTARLIALLLDVGVGDGVDAGELQRPEEAADQQQPSISATGRRGGERPLAAMKARRSPR